MNDNRRGEGRGGESKLGDFGDSLYVREEESRLTYVFLALAILLMVVPPKALENKGGEICPKRSICEF